MFGDLRSQDGVSSGDSVRILRRAVAKTSNLTFCFFFSILKKTCPSLRERLTFSGKGSWPHLSLESIGELAAVPVVGAEAMDVLNTGEKLFIFRNPKEPEISLHIPSRKKKKNFLNAKKATWALGMD